jgi:hypothetical protein
LQVTNRDLSIAVLRRFLPLLQQDQSAGVLKRTSKDRRRQKQQKAKGKQQDNDGDEEEAGDGQPQEQPAQQDAAAQPTAGGAGPSGNPKPQVCASSTPTHGSSTTFKHSICN